MAVSLVSTGVQFPDATIQTTAAAPAGYVYITTLTASSGSNNFDVTTQLTTAYKNFALYYSNIISGPYSAQPWSFRIFRGGSIVTSSTYGSRAWTPAGSSFQVNDYDSIPTYFMSSKFNYTNGWVYINSPFSSLSGGTKNLNIVTSFMQTLGTGSSVPTYWQNYATNGESGTFSGIRLYNPETPWGYFGDTATVDIYGIK
jgi:hypothetical protein